MSKSKAKSSAKKVTPQSKASSPIVKTAGAAANRTGKAGKKG